MLELLPILASAPMLVALSIIDLRTRRIPDPLSLGALVIPTVVMTLLGGDRRIVFAAVGMVAMAATLGLIHLVRPDGLGLGDVKLGLGLGLLLGWSAPGGVEVVSAIAWAFVASSSIGLTAVLVGNRTTGRPVRSTTVPFGPALCSGTVAVAVLGLWLG